MCMKRDNLFLSLLIPDPKNSEKYLDIFLRPLIDELKLLWTDGVHTYNASTKKIFTIKVALMWMISDFPVFEMLSGWNIHGKLLCLYYMHDTKSLVLKHGGKPCWFDCHRQFLPIGHPFRRQKDAFLKNTIEMNEVDLERLSGRDMAAHVRNIPDMTQLAGTTRPLWVWKRSQLGEKKYFLRITLLVNPSCTSQPRRHVRREECLWQCVQHQYENKE